MGGDVEEGEGGGGGVSEVDGIEVGFVVVSFDTLWEFLFSLAIGNDNLSCIYVLCSMCVFLSFLFSLFLLYL